MDVWVLNGHSIGQIPHLASWVPVDHDPLPPKVLEYFTRTGARPIAMSRFGQAKLAERGLDPLYVPHGIDTGVFKHRPRGRADLRELVEIPEDAFVVGVVAANKGIAPPRKAFPQTFQAFAKFHKTHPDAYLYLHTEMSGAADGVNLGALAEMTGVPFDAIKFTPPWQMELGVTPETLSCLYSAMDVLCNPSYGEGFGVPIMEAQSCGLPVIVTDHSAMPELCGAGWLVGGDSFYDATQGSFYRCPSIDEIVEAMEAAYEARNDQALKAQARDFALGYDADRVLQEHWVPALDRLAEMGAKPKTLEPIA
jgi:glycosyltransferase involved in cell wall biosynthesis